jgi:hypothetical protein
MIDTERSSADPTNAISSGEVVELFFWYFDDELAIDTMMLR